ncbi:MAG: DUF2240 family protein [Methanosarcinaceae archaeon]
MRQLDDLTLVIAAPFKKNAVPSLSLRDFEFALSFDLKWMSPAEASKVRDMAIKSGHLKLVDGMLKPVFDLGNTEIPHGFKPEVDLFKENTLLEQIMEHISTSTGMGLQDIASKINAKQEQFSYLMNIEVAAMLVAREAGCDIDSVYEQVYDAVIR